MIRRRFIQLIALSGMGGLTAVEGLDRADSETVTFHVTGFTCVTCAVGLETMLLQQRGVTRASASYPERKVTIIYRPKYVSVPALHQFIREMGFHAEQVT